MRHWKGRRPPKKFRGLSAYARTVANGDTGRKTEAASPTMAVSKRSAFVAVIVRWTDMTGDSATP